MQRLIILSLDTNHIADDGALALTDAIEALHKLREIYIYKNEIGDKGMIQIMKEVKAHEAMKVLDIRCNKLSSAMIERISSWYSISREKIALHY